MSYNMSMTQPAAWWNGQWREGIPLGNGFTGALVYGRAMYERILLNHASAWRETHQPELPDVSDMLADMRRLIIEKKVAEADSLLVDALKRKGYNANTGYPFPIADILLTTQTIRGFTNYSRRLDMESAQAFVRYVDDGLVFERRCFVSRADDVFVLELVCSGELPHIELRLDMHQPDEVNAHHIELPINVQTQHVGDWLYYSAEVDEIAFGAVARLVHIPNGLLILAKVFPEGNSDHMWKNLKLQLSELPTDYDILLSRHLPLHKSLFMCCQFKLEDECYSSNTSNEKLLESAYIESCPNALVERMWAYGRYLLVCATAPGSLPCPLMGLWSGEYRAGWSFNMANINMEMIYWQALPGMMTELVLPVFDYIDNLLPGLRENSRMIFGARGICLSAVSTPGNGRLTCLAPHIVNWTGGAGWMGQLYYDYWLYTRDEQFLIKRCYPFLYEVGLFYEDFAVWEGDTWHIIPSVSPENRTLAYAGGAILPDSMQTSIDATMDIAIIREVYTNLLKIGAICGASEKECDTWRIMLKGSPEYQMNEYGAVREWNHPDFPDNDLHRHLSHLYPLFPGIEHARSVKSEIFHKAVQKRLNDGVSYVTSWSLMLAGCSFARARDAEEAVNCMDLCARAMLMGNLFTVHNDWRGMGIGLNMDWAPFQIDANMGWTALVHEMLLFSDEDSVEFYPAIPKRWKSGSIGPMNTRCGLVVELNWNIQERTAQITAVRDCVVRLLNADGNLLGLRIGDVRIFSYKVDDD